MRNCGDCQLCCEIFSIASVEKPAYKQCRHQCDSGCSIHQFKPAECVNFDCEWRRGNLVLPVRIPEEFSPLTVGGFFVFKTEPAKHLIFFAQDDFEMVSVRFRSWLQDTSECLPILIKTKTGKGDGMFFGGVFTED